MRSPLFGKRFKPSIQLQSLCSWSRKIIQTDTGLHLSAFSLIETHLHEAFSLCEQLREPWEPWHLTPSASPNGSDNSLLDVTQPKTNVSIKSGSRFCLFFTLWQNVTAALMDSEANSCFYFFHAVGMKSMLPLQWVNFTSVSTRQILSSPTFDVAIVTALKVNCNTYSRLIKH